MFLHEPYRKKGCRLMMMMMMMCMMFVMNHSFLNLFFRVALQHSLGTGVTFHLIMKRCLNIQSHAVREHTCFHLTLHKPAAVFPMQKSVGVWLRAAVRWA